MKKLNRSIMVTFFFWFALVAGAQTKKYDIKSGIVTYDLTMKMGTMNVKTKVIVYFDDYGMKECKETYYNEKLSNSYFSDGKELYLLQHKEKLAIKRGTAYSGTEFRVEWTEFGSEKDRQSGTAKKLPNMTILGKSCVTFGTDDGKGSVATYAGWDKILLYLNVKSQGTETTQQAVKLEENAKVPADKFMVPKDYTLQPG
ncbi:MAG TPA: hypothetical protein VIS48_00715 [Candidatus Kryptonia bacterium]